MESWSDWWGHIFFHTFIPSIYFLALMALTWTLTIGPPIAITVWAAWMVAKRRADLPRRKPEFKYFFFLAITELLPLAWIVDYFEAPELERLQRGRLDDAAAILGTIAACCVIGALVGYFYGADKSARRYFSMWFAILGLATLLVTPLCMLMLAMFFSPLLWWFAGGV